MIIPSIITGPVRISGPDFYVLKKPFIKADGTMNIHDVLWAIILTRK
jgi:hypothetical protein